jgi:YD repeat-containing protein
MDWADYHTRRETVTLPYDQDQSGQLDTYYLASPGVMHRMRLPTRGYLEWDYRAYRFPNGWEFDPDDRQRPDFWSESQGVAARRLLNYNQDSMGGEWWYQPEYRFTQEVIGGVTREVPEEILTTVIDPHGTATDNYFNAQLETWAYGLPFTDHQPTHSSHNRLRYLSQVIRPASGVRGNVRKVHLEYEHDSCLGRLDQGQYDCQRRVKSERMDFGAGFFRLTNRATFDGFGNYDWSVKISNYRNGGDERHETYRDHRKILPTSAQSWILGTYSRSSERENYYNGDPSNYFKFETEHCFDLATGAELRTRRKKDAGVFNNRDVVQVSTFNSQGNVVGEHWYGGDTQSVSLSSNLCSMSLPGSAVHGRTHTYQNGSLASTKIDGLSYYPYRGTVDANTGLLQESRQANGFSTDYDYDALSRIRLVTPEQGSKTEYYYENASGDQLSAPADPAA